MASRSAIYEMLPMLPPGNMDDVLRFVAGLYALGTGPAECECCGAFIPDVSGLPACGGRALVHAEWVPCANLGKHWKLSKLKQAPQVNEESAS